MATLTIHPAASLQGTLTVPGDKSISHRALLLGAISQGVSRITHCLKARDLQTTLQTVQGLGILVQEEKGILRVEGKGLRGLTAPAKPLEMGNSGTTARLLLGILAGQPFSATLTGDPSLSRRPMGRVTEPLMEMGAKIQGPQGLDRLPLTIQGGRLRGIEFIPSIHSAQVKSAVLLAGLYAQGPTTVIEGISTRDHTEQMLIALGARLRQVGVRIILEPGGELKARGFHIPGDFSSAAFFLAGVAIVPGSKVTIEGIGLNRFRTGLLWLLGRMGAVPEVRTTSGGDDWEPFGEVTLAHRPLQGITVERESVPEVIDELPVFMVVATQAQGITRIEGAGELKIKETDRIHSMITGLIAMGAKIETPAPSGGDSETIVIEGPTRLKGARVQSFGDHRTAMALAVAALAAEGSTTIQGSEWIDISFPGFAQMLEKITRH